MSELLVEIGRYVVAMNELKRKRQQARSKVSYYKAILNRKKEIKEHPVLKTGMLNGGYGVRGWNKWNKPGQVQYLRILVKKNAMQQLKYEIELHEFVISMRKRLIAIRKEMPYSLISDCTKLNGVWLGIYPFGKRIPLDEVEQIVLNQEIEDILLRGVS